MNINPFEIINVLVIFILFFLMVQKRDAQTLLVILFSYGTFHFAFSTLTLYSDDYTNRWSALHMDGGGMLAEISAFLLIGSVYILLSRDAFKQFLLSKWSEKKIVILIFLIMIAVCCGYLFNIRTDDWSQLKNVISIEAMLALLLIGTLVLGNNNKPLSLARLKLWGRLGLILFALIDSIAIYEVFSHRSWAGTLQSSGEMVYRASSVLFNPNLFGFWGSLVFLGCAYGMYEYKECRKIMIGGMILASIAIYFSGSRSTGYILLGVLVISTPFIKERLRWIPVIVLLVTMLSIYVITLHLIIPSVTNKEGWYEIVFLGDRFSAAPLQVINYILMHIGSTTYFTIDVPTEITQSIEGRFIGKDRDGGWLALYFDIGWLGVIAIVLMSVTGLWWGVKTLCSERSVASVFSLTIFCYCLLTGITMRYQVFPIWLFIGVILTPCLAFWMRVNSSILFNTNKINS